MANWKSPRRLCLTDDGEVVSHKDPKGVKLLIGKGAEMPLAKAQALKLDAVCAELDEAEEETCNVGTDDGKVIGNKAAHDAAKAKAEAKAAEEAKAKADAAKAKAAK